MSLSFIAINIIVPIVSAKQLVYITGNLYLELLIASLIVLIINCIAAINHWVLRKETQTIEIINPTVSERNFTLMDASFTNIPIIDGQIIIDNN